jgi:hypothetical protein
LVELRNRFSSLGHFFYWGDCWVDIFNNYCSWGRRRRFTKEFVNRLWSSWLCGWLHCDSHGGGSFGLRRPLSCFLSVNFFPLVYALFLEKAEDVVQHEVPIGLFGQKEGLDELAPSFAMVGHFTNDLDDYPTICRRLSINRVNENLAVIKTNGGDFFVDFL